MFLTIKIWTNQQIVRPKELLSSQLCYVAEKRPLYVRDIQNLERFHQELRSLLSIKREHYVTKNKILERTNNQSIELLIMKQSYRS